MSRFLRAGVVAAGVVAFVAAPGTARAQKEPFVSALIAFRTAIAGTFGDEGPRVTASLDQMAASLAEWERLVTSAEADMRTRLATATGAELLFARTTLASIYVDPGRFRDALTEIDAAIEVDPKRPAFHLFRGLIREAIGEDPVADFRRAWTSEPGDPIKAYLLADRTLARDAAAAVTLQVETLTAAYAAAEKGAGAPSFIVLALVEDRAADWAVFAPAAYVEGFELIAARRYGEAVASFRAAAALDPLVNDPALRRPAAVQGIAALRQQQYAAAIPALEAAAAAAPKSSEVHRILAAAYGAAGRAADSVAALEAAVRLMPGDERARVALGRALMKAERWEEAEGVLRQAIAALPRSADARLALADLYESRQRGADAIPELEAVAALPMLAGRGRLLWRLAELHHQHQDFDAVARLLDERVRLDPNSAQLRKDLGLAEMRRGRRDEALLELLMVGILGAPDDIDTLATIGQIHLDAGRYDAAEPVLRRAVALSPAHAQARFALGTTLVRMGRAEEGRKELAEFQRLRNAALEEQRKAFEKLGQPAPALPTPQN